MNAQSQTKDITTVEATITANGDCFVPGTNLRDYTFTEAALFEALEDDVRPGFAFGFTAKRLYDIFFSGCGLLLLSPLLLLIAVLVKVADRGAVFYRQKRVGLGSREFLIYKFRTMVAAAEMTGPAVTKQGDSRITWIGRILRKTKLDELPQLWNVLRGDMSLVGPRPEVPHYVRHYTPEQRRILRLRPGITDLASLYFRDEEALLANAENLEQFYIQHCIPRKVKLNQDYAARANVLSDTWIILQTICPYWTGVMACYGIILAAAFCLSYELVYNFAPPSFSAVQFWRGLGITLAFQLGCLAWRWQFRRLLSYFSFPELQQLGAALGFATVGLLAISIATRHFLAANFVLVNAFISFCSLAGFRILLWRWRERSSEKKPTDATAAGTNPPARVGIIGAGCTGAQLAMELIDNRRFGRQVVAFFDDDFHKWQKNIHDVPVAGMPECLLDGWAGKIDEVVIAMPGASTRRIQELQQLLRRTRLKCYTVSGLARFWEHQAA